MAFFELLLIILLFFFHFLQKRILFFYLDLKNILFVVVLSQHEVEMVWFLFKTLKFLNVLIFLLIQIWSLFIQITHLPLQSLPLSLNILHFRWQNFFLLQLIIINILKFLIILFHFIHHFPLYIALPRQIINLLQFFLSHLFKFIKIVLQISEVIFEFF